MKTLCAAVLFFALSVPGIIVAWPGGGGGGGGGHNGGGGVPEPLTIALIAAGGAGAVGLRKAIKRK
ncbi:MAG: PEP-CTERM sorting domain-containing protein [Myxococcota bacterium]|nr:PEP-CTERM sorting domain-containing protein [Myxococcota bacterium]